jgi:hypothetical protein
MNKFSTEEDQRQRSRNEVNPVFMAFKGDVRVLVGQ